MLAAACNMPEGEGSHMIMTTTPTVEGKAIAQYLGLVHSIPQVNPAPCINIITNQAQELGADAVVDVTVVASGKGNSHVRYVAIGTAVKLK